ncbi:MAG: flagellar basal body P-ring formation protein FlgA [Betaproteobacteria bacterium]|nr:flagellar basal body P-ring formation protein FlgA [Betaproteobacteria bacterium]
MSNASQSSLKRLFRVFSLALLPLMVHVQIQAQTVVPMSIQTAPSTAIGGETELEQLAGQWLQPTIASVLGQEASGALRPELILGRLDPRLKLAPCQRVEPYIPPGTRLWGRSRIGLRCLEGVVRWNVFLPVTVRAWGPAWVLRRPVAAGAVLTQEDADIAEIDWAEQHAAVLADTSRWVGQQAAYALPAGQALRQNMVRPVPAFGPGAQVRVASQGNGFRVTVVGEALTAGIEGQSVKVRLKGGRVVTGTVREDQTVEVRL